MQRIVQRVGQPGAVVFRGDRQRNQCVVEIGAVIVIGGLLEDFLLLEVYPDGDIPHRRQLTAHRNPGDLRGLIVGDQILLERRQVVLQRLVGPAKIRLVQETPGPLRPTEGLANAAETSLHELRLTGERKEWTPR